jgi:beta-lactamase class D
MIHLNPMIKITFTFVLVSAMMLAGCRNHKSREIKADYKNLYDRYRVDGSFVLYDQDKETWTFYNKDQYTVPYTPASTFKICNTLIGLETGVIKDENFILRWDGVVRRIPAWNQDQSLATAFRNSTVWYYQELARRVGSHRMKYWLDRANYGNADTSGGIDRFWLSGGLRMTEEQQVDFLRRLHDGRLPFSKRSVDILKKVMILEDTNGYILRAKTGWGIQDSLNIGWFVGYVETKGNVYYFANCIRTADGNNPDFARGRIEIAKEILAGLKITSR